VYVFFCKGLEMSVIGTFCDSSGGLATGYELDDPGLIPGSAKFVSSQHHADRL
jgi:hypothetical protein